MGLREWVPRWWAGEGGVPGMLLDAALLPAELLFRGAAALRNRLYDRGVLRTAHVRVPVVSVGNIAVGGAGKTPVSAWLVRHLADAGHRPALVLRGYGDDEKLVHRELNPDVPVLAAARRIDAARIAAEGGRDVVVLDDALQHRALHRDLDVVLVAAEGWSSRRRLLPRGPWREDAGALSRAGLVVVTRKSAPEAEAERVAEELRCLAPSVPVARCALEPSGLAPLHAGASTGLRPDGSNGIDIGSFSTSAVSSSSADIVEMEDDGADLDRPDLSSSTGDAPGSPDDTEPVGNASPLPQNWGIRGGRVLGRGPTDEETVEDRRRPISPDTEPAASRGSESPGRERQSSSGRGTADETPSVAAPDRSLPRSRGRAGEGVVADGEKPADLSALAGERVLAVAALAAPGPFFDQLRAAGAEVEPAVFPDHHDFDAAEATALLRRAAGRRIVMTLKDAVKLRPLLPRGARALLVTQRLRWEAGEDALEAALRRALEEGGR